MWQNIQRGTVLNLSQKCYRTYGFTFFIFKRFFRISCRTLICRMVLSIYLGFTPVSKHFTNQNQIWLIRGCIRTFKLEAMLLKASVWLKVRKFFILTLVKTRGNANEKFCQIYNYCLFLIGSSFKISPYRFSGYTSSITV